MTENLKPNIFWNYFSSKQPHYPKPNACQCIPQLRHEAISHTSICTIYITYLADDVDTQANLTHSLCSKCQSCILGLLDIMISARFICHIYFEPNIRAASGAPLGC